MNIEFYKSKNLVEIRDYLNDDLYIDFEKHPNESCYFFCLRRNETFKNDLNILLKKLAEVAPFFDQNLIEKTHRRKLGKRNTNSMFPTMHDDFNFFNKTISNLNRLYKDEVELIYEFNETYKAFILKWRIFPPFNLNMPFVFSETITSQEFDSTKSAIEVPDNHLVILTKKLFHQFDLEILKIKTKNPFGNKRNNIRNALRAYKIHEDLNFSQWPKRELMNLLVFDDTISSLEDYEYYSRLDKLMSNAKEYVNNPLIVLNSIS